jgi:hypothetical protein
VQGSEFDEIAFFRQLTKRQVRAVLIGRRALVVLGLPVLTADYDLWIHIDDIGTLNELSQPFGLHPSKSVEQARATGRYVLENDERVDVLVARSVPTTDGVAVAFDDIWPRRQTLQLADDANIALPSLDDLILTKRFAARPKDLEDIRLLQALRDGDKP